jgi:hypothetical protein
MKISLLFVSPLVLLAMSLSPERMNSLGIGQSCYFFAVINSANMTANPWPITAGVNVNCVLTGIMGKDESIGDVIVTQSIGTSSSKNNVTLNKPYTKGDTFTFSYSFTAPISSGSYNEKFQVMQNVTQNTLLCWQFSFII